MHINLQSMDNNNVYILISMTIMMKKELISCTQAVVGTHMHAWTDMRGKEQHKFPS
jgi:hypothetical protein